jgi:hypothetical protein
MRTRSASASSHPRPPPRAVRPLHRESSCRRPSTPGGEWRHPPPQILTHPSYVALLARVDDVLTDFADFAKRPQKRWRAGPSSPPLPVSMTSSPTSRRDHRSAGVRDPRRPPSPVSMTSSPTSRRDHRSAGVRDPRRPPSSAPMASSPTSRRDHRSAGVRDPRRPGSPSPGAEARPTPHL